MYEACTSSVLPTVGKSAINISLLYFFCQDCSREVVAIKCVESSTLSKSAVDNLVTEINLLKVLKHEHVVEMKDFFWSDGFVNEKIFHNF